MLEFLLLLFIEGRDSGEYKVGLEGPDTPNFTIFQYNP
jgi:hypothetical protein